MEWRKITVINGKHVYWNTLNWCLNQLDWMMMLSKMIAATTTASLSPPTITDIREDINNVLKEWHFGTEYMFDNEDLECMADDIMKIINKKYQLPLKQKQSRNKLITTK